MSHLANTDTVLPSLAWAMPVRDELFFSAGVVLVLAGLFLRWRFGDAWMSAEEQVKEGRLSEDQARRRIAVARYSGPVIVVLGIIAFVLVFAEG